MDNTVRIIFDDELWYIKFHVVPNPNRMDLVSALFDDAMPAYPKKVNTVSPAEFLGYQPTQLFNAIKI